jgi:CPA2 family monovalent cation:H+ antiporter-2
VAVEGHDVWLKDAAVFLVAAGVIVPALKAVRISAVLGFLLAGLALGPFLLGGLADRFPLLEWVTITDTESAAPFAELGVLFLLFLLGLELSFQRLWALRKAVFGAGGLQAAASAVAIGAACFFIGLAGPAAVVIGLALALSSTAIVMQILSEERRVATPTGRTALAVLLMQDILVAPILILAGFLARDADGGIGAALLEAFIQGAIAIVVIVFLGRVVLKPAFRLVARVGGRDLMMAIILATVVGASLLTAEAGLSLALGAFLAGLLLGETEFKHQAEVDLEPFKGLLLGVFFTTVGIGLDLAAVWNNAALVLGGLAAMLVVKFIVVYVAARLFAGGHPVALEAAFLLAPAGEFAFVILASATAGNVVDAQTANIVTAIAGLSMLLTPGFAMIGRRIALSLETKAQVHGPPAETLDSLTDLDGHAVIAGMGRVGRAIARVLEAEGVEVLALDRNAERVKHVRREGWRVYFGDASNPDILTKAGADTASLFVVTADDPDKACAMVSAMRALRSDATILARARDAAHGGKLRAAGATHVTPEAVEAALQMAGRALEDIGLPAEAVRDRIAQERDDEYARIEQES